MEFVAWLIVGGIVGWLASLITAPVGGPPNKILLNFAVGIVGACLGALLLSPLVPHLGEEIAKNSINIFSVLTAICGAILLLVVVNVLISLDDRRHRS